MFGYEEIKLQVSYSPLYFVIALILIGIYAFYVYRFTIPPVGNLKKIILVSLRTLALLTILFIFFEPLLSFTKKLILEPVNLIFIDNSRSIRIVDGTERTNNVKRIAEDFLSHPISGSDEYYLFGSKLKILSGDSLQNLSFNDPVTNISQIFAALKKDEKNYSTLTLISDGVITAGSNSLYTAKNLGLPIFSIGIGDTAQKKDIEIKRVLYNNLLYNKTPTSILSTLKHNGYPGKNITVSLYEFDTLIEQKNIELNTSGIQNVDFTYAPQTEGEKKLAMVVSILPDEFTSENNRQVFYIDVLTNKVKVSILAGSPSADLTFIKGALRSDDNFTVKSLTQSTKDIFLEERNTEFIDSANIFILVGFPSNATPPDLLNKIKTRINEDRIPFLLIFNNDIDLSKLNTIQSVLPFTAKSEYGGVREVQPYIFENQKSNPIIQNNSHNVIDSWNNLPPVFQPSFEFIARPESNVIAKTKVNNNVLNSPLIVSRSFSNRRSIAVLAGSIWKWKLQTARKRNDLFDRFIINSVKWLNASDEDKRVNIRSSKKTYSLGEPVEFSAQVYDESINPAQNAEVKLILSFENEKIELELNNIGNGLYEGSTIIKRKGDFKFSGKAFLNGKTLGSDSGIFNVGDVDIEMINPVMNFEYLNLLANETKGEFYTAYDYSEVFEKIREVNKKSIKEKIVTSEITLWSDEWLLAIAVFLFSLEWFLRKRAGML